MKKAISVLIILLMMLPCIVKASMFFTYDNSLTKVNNFILSYYEYKRYVITKNPNFICSSSDLCTFDSSFTTGGFLNIYEYLVSGGKKSYLFDMREYFTHKNNNRISYISSNPPEGYDDTSDTSFESGIRISEYIKPSAEIDGNGTYADPWVFLYSNPLLNIVLNGGTTSQFNEGDAIECEPETDFVITSNPSHSTKIFDNWQLSATDATLDGNTIHMGNDDATLTALFRDPVVTIDLNGGTSSQFTNGQTISMAYNETMNLNSPTPTNSNYVFIYWTVTDSSSSITGSTFKMGNKDVTLKAIYMPIVTTYPSVGGYTYNVLASGRYKLEIWGAGGTGISSWRGGFAAFARGEIYINKETHPKMYVYVGGQGGVTWYGRTEGGFNGGGYAYVLPGFSYGGGAGGGATHIAYGAVDRGVLKNYESYKSDMIIVAGGGGGANYDTYTTSYNSRGGDAGGYNSPGICRVDENNVWTCADGATTSSGGYSGGSFGQGGGLSCLNPGGGGGWYGGGTAWACNGGGAGGSSYVGNTELTNKVMYCYSNGQYGCSGSAPDYTYTTTCYSGSPIVNCTKTGSGYARITYLGS